MGYSNKYPHEIMSSKKHKKGSLVKKIASFLAVFFILMSVGYGVGIVPESWIDAIEYIASPLDGPQGLWKGDKNTGDTQTSSQDNAAVQGTRTQVSGTLNVEFIDVGQADAILIYNDENAMLIDAGNNPDGKPLTNYIKSLGIDHLDYVIGTHNHEDHIGGMDDVITAYSSEVDYIMLSEEEGTTATYRSVVEAADSSSAEQLTPKAGETYTLGDATWQILSCDTDMPDLNESSIVIKLTYGNTSFLLPTNILLAGLEGELVSEIGRSFRLKNALKDSAVRDVYDYVLIDTPPSLGILTTNAIVAADYILIPTDADSDAISGIAQLGNTIQQARQYCNVDPKILGILFTKFDPRQNNSKDMMKVAMQAANALDTKVFNTFIRSAVIVKETKSRELDLLTAAPDSTVAMDYMALADEIAKEGI